MQQLIQDIKNSTNSKILISKNLQKIKEYLQMDISTFNTTQIKFLLSNPNFNIKCSCQKDKKWLRHKFLASCGDKNCIKLSTKNTSKAKYGVDHPTQLLDTQIKKNKTNLEKYGNQHVLQNKDIKNKQEQTMINRFGTAHALQNKDIKNKQEQTVYQNYKVTNVFESDIIQSKIKNTNINKYGFEVASKNLNIRLKQSKKLRAKFIQNSELLTKDYIESNFINSNNNFKVLDFMDYFNYSTNCAPYRVLRQLGVKFDHLKGTSHQEKEVLKYIQSITTSSILSNDRNIIDNLELDIFIPDSKLAVEYNGLYWHSYGLINTSIKQSDKLFQQNRHLDKTKQVEELSQAHQIFHIFENEWLNDIKQDIWKSIISDKFKLNKRVYARDTIVKLVESSEANQFIFENHIQGIRNAPIRLGLYKGDELLSIMTFGKPFNKSECEYELIRFCNKKYTSVIGGASKLLKYFERTYNPKSILSYANRRWSRGNLYYQLGFELQNISKPNKFIINWTTKTLSNRLEFQKHKLADKLELYDQNLSADQNIINNNYRIIWDCGNYVFTKNYKYN